MENKNKKILIIDDEKELLEGVGEFLKTVADQVLTAENGAAGVELFRANPGIGAVVCDINMPGMKGMEVIEIIRGMDAKVPFIFFTGFGSRENMHQAAKFGAFDFIEKPDIKGLAEAVDSAFIYAKNERGEAGGAQEEIRHLSEYKKLLDLKANEKK